LLLETVANATGTFFDDIADEDLKGRLMGSVNNSAPYENLRYLTERFGTFYGVLGTKLYYTKGDGYAQYWPRTNYFELFEPITSIASIAGGLLIFTKTSTSLLVGSDAATFALIVLDKTIGCISHACTVSTGSTALFLSSHGLCAATTSGVDHVTLPILGSQQLASVCAVYVNKCYYLQLTSGRLLCLDFRYGTTIYYLDFASTYITTDNEALFLVSGGVFKQAFTGAPASYSYATGLLTEGEYTNLKSYNKFYLRSTGDVTVSIQIDGDVVLTKALSGDATHEITPPQQHRRGYGLKLAFSGTGTVFEVVTSPTARET
jgi:hypothetical protein